MGSQQEQWLPSARPASLRSAVASLNCSRVPKRDASNSSEALPPPLMSCGRLCPPVRPPSAQRSDPALLLLLGALFDYLQAAW
jgi:hypothetical protein